MSGFIGLGLGIKFGLGNETKTNKLENFADFLLMKDDFLQFASNKLENRIDPMEIQLVLSFFILHFIVNAIFYFIFKNEKTKGGTLKRQFVAYEITAFIPCTYLAYWGLSAYFLNDTIEVLKQQDRFYTYSKYFAPMSQMTVAYEIYNTFAVLLIPEYRTVAFVLHHIMTLGVALFSKHPFLHFYGLFFVGVSSFTNVWLGIVDLCEIGLNKYIPGLETFSRLAFAVSFLWIRTFWWPLVSYDFWLDAIEVLNNGKAHSESIIYFYMVANIFLTSLQLLWSTTVIKGIIDLISPPPKSSLKKKQL